MHDHPCANTQKLWILKFVAIFENFKFGQSLEQQ